MAHLAPNENLQGLHTFGAVLLTQASHLWHSLWQAQTPTKQPDLSTVRLAEQTLSRLPPILSMAKGVGEMRELWKPALLNK